MLRITEERTRENKLVLQLEGQLIGPWVSELNRLCEKSAPQGRGFSIDLALLSFADRDGISLLKDLRNRGAAVINGSPFLREQLHED